MTAAASLILAVVRVTPGMNDALALVGALLAAVIVLLEARSKGRTLANIVTVFIGSTFIGGITPGVLFYNVWPAAGETFTWHIWISLGFAVGLIGWAITSAAWRFVERNSAAFIARFASRYADRFAPPPKEPPGVDDDVPMHVLPLIALLAVSLAFTGCAGQRVHGSETGTLAGHLATAETANADARRHIVPLQSNLSRADAKATVILEWLRQHRRQ